MPIDFSGIPKDSVLGKTLRAPLKLIPDGTIVRVLQGPVKSSRWIVGSSTAGCWLGTYELAKVRRFVATVRPGMTVFDVGAHVGYYTLIAAKLVGGSGHVVAFEPNPRNLGYLRRHLSLNRVSNVEVMDVAVTDRAGVEGFDARDGSSLGRLDPAGAISVWTNSLDQLLRDGAVPPPHVMKFDIEGAESDALAGAVGVLDEVRPTVFVATHGPEIHESCISILTHARYVVSPIEGRAGFLPDELIARPAP